MCKLLLAAGANIDSRIRVPPLSWCRGEAERLTGIYPKERREDLRHWRSRWTRQVRTFRPSFSRRPTRPVSRQRPPQNFFSDDSTPVQLARTLGHIAVVKLLEGWPHKAPIRARMWKKRLQPAMVLQEKQRVGDSWGAWREAELEAEEAELEAYDLDDDFDLKQQRALMWQVRREQHRTAANAAETDAAEATSQQTAGPKESMHQPKANAMRCSRHFFLPAESPGRLMSLQEASEHSSTCTSR